MGTKLHIGCGDDLKSGYINLDAYNPRADLQIPLQAIDFPDNSVERIEGYMVLEHLTIPDARTFASKAYHMLEPGGALILEVPDLEKVSRLILAFADDPQYLDEGAFGLRGLFGQPTENMTPGDYHKWGYTPATAVKLMQDAGFARVAIQDGLSHCYPLRDMRIEAYK